MKNEIKNDQHQAMLLQQAQQLIDGLMVSNDGKTWQQAFPEKKKINLEQESTVELIRMCEFDAIPENEKMEIGKILAERIPNDQVFEEVCELAMFV